MNEEEILFLILKVSIFHMSHIYLKALRSNQNASSYCDDWWHVTEGHFITIVTDKVIKDASLRIMISKA